MKKSFLLALMAITIILISGCVQPSNSNNIISSGTYTCDTCKSSHTWHIDDKHLMYWDGQPYIPVVATDNSENVPAGITEVSLYIDEDKLATGYTEAQYFQEIDRKTNDYIANGKTYILGISYPFPKQDARWLLDANEMSKMAQKWKEYAPYVRKEGLRAIFLFNEINCEWRWPADGAEIHAKMGQLADQAQQIFGEVPVSYKTAWAACNFNDVYLGNLNADGHGFDLYPKECSSAGFDQETQKQVSPNAQEHLNALKNRISSSRKLGLLWMAEFGKRSGLTEEQLQGMPPEAGYETYKTKEELKCHIDRYIGSGFTGFFHGTWEPDNRDFEWLAELKPYIQQKVIEKSGKQAS